MSRINAALAAAPDDAELQRLKATLALAEGDRALARASLEKAIELDPSNLDAYQQLAALLQSGGRLDEALALYLTALKQRPSRIRVRRAGTIRAAFEWPPATPS